MEDQWLRFRRWWGAHRVWFLDLSFWGKYWNTETPPSSWPAFLINFYPMRESPISPLPWTTVGDMASLPLWDPHTQPVQCPPVSRLVIAQTCAMLRWIIYTRQEVTRETRPFCLKCHEGTETEAGCRVRGAGWRDPRPSRREDAAVKKMKCNEILFHA